MRDPEVMDFSPKTKSVDTIEQFYFTVDQERKFDLLVKLLKRDQPRAGDRLLPHEARHRTNPPPACARSFPGADMMHGDMVQTRPRPRDEGLPRRRRAAPGGHRRRRPRHRRRRAFRTSSTTTSRSRRDDYVHRVGRTGRMGREGIAYTFVTTEEGGELTRIEMLINRLLKRDEIEGFSAVATTVPNRRPPPQTRMATKAMNRPSHKSRSRPRPRPPGRRPVKRHRKGL